MGFLLLGIDSLIAYVIVGPMVNRRWGLPFAALFGVCDGAGFLLGTALHFAMPDSIGRMAQTAILGSLGLYWIVVGMTSGRARGLVSRSSRLVWILPFALTVDNITFGAASGTTGSVLARAGEQALSSALLAGVGLAISLGVVRVVPALRRYPALSSGIAGAGLILASGAMLIAG